MTRLKLIIAGSRDLVVPLIEIDRVIDDIIVREGGCIAEIVSGKEPTGADASGERWANERGIPVTPFRAEWVRYGNKAAGPIRNERMARYADRAVIFLKAKPTPGSSNMATWMLVLNKPVRVVML